MNIQEKSAFVSIVGKPNVGKSSLLNVLLGEKVAIVSNKPQTTRTRITGVLTENETQLVFIDTPGFHKSKTKLSDNMIKAVNDSLADVDVIMMVVEPYGKLTEAENTLLENIKNEKGVKTVLVINKIDLIKNKEDIITRINDITSVYKFDTVVPISTVRNDGIDALKKELCNIAEEGPHFFPDDTLTDQPERVIVSEIIREKMLNALNQEVPHGIAVVIEKMREREDKELFDVEATIYCERKTHKGIIIGKSGAMLKKILTQARTDIEAFLDCKVNLQCWVKVKEDWRNNDNYIRNFGLSEDK